MKIANYIKNHKDIIKDGIIIVMFIIIVILVITYIIDRAIIYDLSNRVRTYMFNYKEASKEALYYRNMFDDLYRSYYSVIIK